MMKPESKRTGIVLLGDFNPKIYHPAWFAALKLIAEAEAEAATVEILNHDVCIFTTGWLRLQVLRERFHATPLQDGHDEEVRDFVAGTFGVLKHTPLRAMGINTIAQWYFPDEETWHRVGHQLVPKGTVWDAVLVEPGMASVVVRGKRPDGHNGFINVTVKPIPKEGRHGVEVEVNDHLQISPQAGAAAEAIVSLLAANWADSRTRADKVFAKLMELPEK